MNSNDFDNKEFAEEYGENDEFFLDRGALFAQRIRNFFTTNTFLAACIAYTVAVAISALTDSADLFSIAIAVGMWLAYTEPKKAAPVKGLKVFQIALKIMYVITIVVAIILAVCSVFMLVVAPDVMALEGDLDTILLQFTEEYEKILAIEAPEQEFVLSEFMTILETEYLKPFNLTYAQFFGYLLITLGIVFIVIAVVSLVINAFFVHKLEKQLKDILEALEKHRHTELMLKGIKNWFFVFGVFNVLSIVILVLNSAMFSALGSAALAFSYFALYKALKTELNNDTKI